MDSEQTIYDFMHSCFRERTAALKLQHEIHRTYRQRFYHDECLYESGRGVVEKSEAEQVVSIAPSDIGISVVTTGTAIYRSRYHVKSSGGSWLIHDVDMECGHCHIFGESTKCKNCDGKGWLSWKDEAKLKNLYSPVSALIKTTTSEEEPKDTIPNEAAIEQFMSELFRERQSSWKKQAKIHSKYWHRFYSPDCAWERPDETLASVYAEEIETITSSSTEVLVTTRDKSPWEHRYHLRPSGQSWLVWEVDLACPSCKLGIEINPKCFLCGGTGWANCKEETTQARGELPGEEPPSQKPRWQP